MHARSHSDHCGYGFARVCAKRHDCASRQMSSMFFYLPHAAECNLTVADVCTGEGLRAYYENETPCGFGCNKVYGCDTENYYQGDSVTSNCLVDSTWSEVSSCPVCSRGEMACCCSASKVVRLNRKIIATEFPGIFNYAVSRCSLVSCIRVVVD